MRSSPRAGLTAAKPLAISRSQPSSRYDRLQECSRVCTIVGGVISPLLANIYLNLVDRIWERRGYQGRRGRWTGALVRYADDLVVLCRTREAADFSQSALRHLFGRMGLTLNEEKSRIATVELASTSSVCTSERDSAEARSRDGSPSVSRAGRP
jgi:hypothetical protein